MNDDRLGSMRRWRRAVSSAAMLLLFSLGIAYAQTPGSADNPAVSVATPVLLPPPGTGQATLQDVGPENPPSSTGAGDVNPTAVVSEDGSTVLEGHVLLGPTCNLVRPTNSQLCGDRPYAATIVLQTADGSQEIARVAADDDGLFSVALDPGTYQVVPLPPPGRVRPYSVPQVVTIDPAIHLSIVIHYDSGIR